MLVWKSDLGTPMNSRLGIVLSVAVSIFSFTTIVPVWAYALHSVLRNNPKGNEGRP